MLNDHYIEEIMLKLEGLQRQLREDVLKVEAPQAKALFETSAVVLLGLHKAFDHYHQQNEAAWEESETKVVTQESLNKKADTHGQTGAPKSSSPTHG